MDERIAWARAVFEPIQREPSDALAGRQLSGKALRRVWANVLGHDEVLQGLHVLRLRGLVELQGTDMVDNQTWPSLIIVTDAGKEACLDPERLSDALEPQRTRTLPGMSTTNNFHAPITNAQVGDNNTLNANTTVVVQHFQQLVHEIQASAAAPNQKSKMFDLIKSLATAISPTIVTELFKHGVAG